MITTIVIYYLVFGLMFELGLIFYAEPYDRPRFNIFDVIITNLFIIFWLPLLIWFVFVLLKNKIRK